MTLKRKVMIRLCIHALYLSYIKSICVTIAASYYLGDKLLSCDATARPALLPLSKAP